MNQFARNKPRWRRLRASIRDTRLLLRQFGWPLIAFCIAIFGGGIIYYLLALKAGEAVLNPAEGMYVVLGLTFLQPVNDFHAPGISKFFIF